MTGGPPPPVRHALGWGDLIGARVGVWGLGTEGLTNLRRLEQLGVGAVLVDDNPSRPDALATAEGGLEALSACEVVVKTPGISRYRDEVGALEATGVAVVGGLGLWLHEADRSRVVCVTGSKGKSTTATVLGHLLNGLGRRTFVGGNLGVPPYDPAVSGPFDAWVVEVSSYQATDLADAPGVVCVTSLSPDHLPWHADDVATYYRDKLSITTLPGPHVTVANGGDRTLGAHAHLLGSDVRWVDQPAERPPWLDTLGLLGAHNDRNALLAAACLGPLGVEATPADLSAAARDVPHLESRLTPVGTVDGVDFVDDSLSTNVLPTVAALDAFPGRAVALLVGGQDRGIDYAPLGDHLRQRSGPTLLVTMPSNGPRILTEVGAVPESVSAPDLTAAVDIAFRWAHPHGGVVLLSPAAPSFDHFRDYRHRAQVFTAAMHDLPS